VTDGPDADQRFDEKEALTGYCSDLILDLNHKYAGSDNGPFFLFHRYRTFNPCENVWMGWERKRGKLLELNNLLRGAGDSFPVKVGDLSVLPQICFVITLDSDTQLPRDVAHRLIGTLAHPLNRAIVDPVTNTVTNGYGILQPRIGISVHSAIRSRLASIYSGQTGFDIYTRAISDVYQDLYGEGIFTGKGIYEVDVFRQVLEHRFPCNALLSHDLIEGAYTRAALVSDIELIDDYPSHFSAYSRRKHRWVRGDWQIMQWLSPRVPDFDGRMVPNPTTVISRWKIFDNLRRSLVDPGVFFLLLAGWLFLPGPPWYWTLAAISLLLLPTYGQAFMSLVRISNWRRPASLLRSTGSAFAKGHLNVLLTFIFLMHQALVTMDAIVRTIVRHRITRRRLLEWETAAEAEDAAKKRPVDIYLAWTPWMALGITLILAFFRPEVCVYAAPILLLWATGRSLARWLSLQNTTPQIILKSQQQKLLRGAALRTWRYFSENSGPAENWLVPDNIQEFPAIVAHRISPTNLGLLLNARQAACALGYITLPEFVRQTTETLSVARGLAKHNGHFYNWYDTKTLQPLDPLFISAVDSGNLVASLWTLKQGCLSLIDEPIFPQCLWQSMLDYVRILDELDPATTSRLNGIVRELGKDGLKWLCELDAVEQEAKAVLDASNEAAHWWAAEFVTRIAAVRDLADNFAPWFRLPATNALRQWVGDPRKCLAGLTPAQVPVLAAQFRIRLKTEAPGDLRDLSDQLSRVSEKSEAVLVDLRRLASEAARMADQMDFRVVYNRRKKLLSVGYDVVAQRLHPACYDLLASEARTAAFVAIAKGDIPQESWFHLGRTQRMYKGRRILLSWTGTMFEYLMPTLWMRTYPRTILDESVRAVIEIQQIHCRKKSTPWGISESATAETDSQGCYQYRAFGLPMLALKRAKMRAHVISPYATFLALEAHPVAATRNLHAIWNQGWVGKYGFYEAIDFQESVSGTLEAKVVKSWMAHHHAMSLMAVSNRLRPSLFQQYFHAEPQVIATELLLHEKLPASLKVESEPDVEPAVNVAKSTPAAA
jgi:cyclic beta-1,2-glucan synthetase